MYALLVTLANVATEPVHRFAEVPHVTLSKMTEKVFLSDLVTENHPVPFVPKTACSKREQPLISSSRRESSGTRPLGLLTR